jgi:hypothetical protein
LNYSSMLWFLDQGELDVDLFEIAQFYHPPFSLWLISSLDLKQPSSCSPSPNFVNNVSLLMLIIAFIYASVIVNQSINQSILFCIKIIYMTITEWCMSSAITWARMAQAGADPGFSRSISPPGGKQIAFRVSCSVKQ